MDQVEPSGSQCQSTPRRERKRGGRHRTSSETSGEFGSPLNSLRSPLRPELTEFSYSEGKRFHRERRFDRRRIHLEKMSLKQEPDQQKQPFCGQNLNEEALLDRHKNKSRNKEFSQSDKYQSPRTVAGATDWGSIIEEEERNIAHENSFRKRLELGKQHLPDCISPDELKDEEYVEQPNTVEMDPMVLERRQKQITYGINTAEYENYRKQVPLQRRTKFHPWTPDKRLKYSRRGWDTVVRIWRKQLHIWDPKPVAGKLFKQNPLDELEDDTDVIITDEKESSFGLNEDGLIENS